MKNTENSFGFFFTFVVALVDLFVCVVWMRILANMYLSECAVIFFCSKSLHQIGWYLSRLKEINLMKNVWVWERFFCHSLPHIYLRLSEPILIEIETKKLIRCSSILIGLRYPFQYAISFVCLSCQSYNSTGFECAVHWETSILGNEKIHTRKWSTLCTNIKTNFFRAIK